VAHVVLFEGLGSAARNAPPERRSVEMAIYEPPPPPPPPEPPPEPPKKKLDLTKAPPPPPDLPPPPNTTEPPPPDAEPAKPVFGISMSSTVGPGTSGFQVRVGNTLMKEPEKEPPQEEVRPMKQVPLHQVQKMPPRIGECQDPSLSRARYEGQVKLSIEVLEDGSVGEVRVLSDFGEPRATALAVQAMKRCKFSPAEVAGKPVGTIIQYKYTFQLE
jgi:periplasmic protein TonB